LYFIKIKINKCIIILNKYINQDTQFKLAVLIYFINNWNKIKKLIFYDYNEYNNSDEFFYSSTSFDIFCTVKIYGGQNFTEKILIYIFFYLKFVLN
jgi:hypothetical protein